MTERRTLNPDEWAFWRTWTQAQHLLMVELDRCLQRDHGISKAEFSVLVTLHQAPGGPLRVGELAESLGWDKSRVSHQLTRMEARDLVTPATNEASNRRIGVELTARGRAVAEQAIEGHGVNLRRHFFDTLTAEQSAAILAWSRRTVARLETRAE